MEPSSLTQDEAHSARNQANSASNGADSALYETDSASETNDEEEYYHPLMTRREKQVHSRKEEYVELRLEEQLPEEQRNKQTVVGHLRRLSPHLGDSDPGEILWPIHRGVNLIGRSEEECSVVIQEEGISAVHALIEVLPSGVHHFVEDIGSTNGTHLGEGRDSLCPYRLYELAHNQIVSFNPVTFRYEKLNLEPRAVSVLSNVEPDSVESPPLKVSKSAPLPSRDAESEGELDEKTLTLVAEENSKADISDELCSNVSKPRTQTRPGPPLTHVKLEPGKAADMSQEIVDAQPNITAPLPHNAPSVEPMSGYCPERVSDSSAINHNSVSLQNSIPATQPLSMNVAPTLSIQQSLLLPPDISQIPHIDSQAGEHLSVIHEGGMGTIIQGHPPPFMTRAKSYTNSTPLNPFEQEEDLGEDVLSPQLGETNLTGDVMAEEVDDGDETEMEEDGEEDRRVTLRAFDPPFGDETTGKLIGGDTQVRKRASNPDVVPMSQTSQGSANLTRVTSRMDRHTDKLDINLKPQNEDLFVGEKGLGVAGDAMAVDLPVLPPPIARKDTNNESSLRTPVRVMSDLMPPTSSPAAASSPPPRFNVANSAAVHIQNRARDQSVNEEVNPKITPPAAADDTDDEEPLQKRRPSKAKSVADSSKSSSHKSSKEPGRGESTNGTLQIPASRPTPPSQQENSDPNNPMAIDTALPSSSPKRKRSPASTEVAPSLRASDEHAADAPVAMPASDDEEEEVAPRSRKRRAVKTAAKATGPEVTSTNVPRDLADIPIATEICVKPKKRGSSKSASKEPSPAPLAADVSPVESDHEAPDEPEVKVTEPPSKRQRASKAAPKAAAKGTKKSKTPRAKKEKVVAEEALVEPPSVDPASGPPSPSPRLPSVDPTSMIAAVSATSSRAVSPQRTTRGGEGSSQTAEDGTVRIMFTGIVDHEQKSKMVTSLGGQTAGDWHECSHLVTDRIRRTVKFLCALSAGKHIVNLKWLDASKKAGKFVAEDKYLLKDAKTEKQYGFRLVKSIAIAHDTTTPRIFSGLEFYSTAAVKPPREELKEILVAAGANLIDKPPPFRAGDKTVIIGHPDDGEEVKELQLAGWTVHSSEFVLTGLLRMEVDYTSHVLPSDVAATPAPTPGGRKKRR